MVDELSRIEELTAELECLRAQLETAHCAGQAPVERTLIPLLESEATLRALVSSAPSVILTVDLAGRILFINRSADPQYTAEQLVGTSLYDHVPADQRSRVRQVVEGVIESGEPDGYDVTVSLEGRPVSFSVRVGPVVRDGEVTGLSLIATDITELIQLRSRLEVADRLASVGTLAAGVAHEINNPLTYLLLKLHRIAQAVDAPTGSALERDIRLALEGAERIRGVVRDLGTFSRSQGGPPRPQDLHRVLELAIQMSTNELKQRARLVREFGEIPPVTGDESRLGQVFLNLLINAAQSIRSGDRRNNEVRVRTDLAGDGRVRVAITDTGSGIPEEVMGRIFEPFVTTRAVGQGTGLGLHICHRIVQELGGRIEASNLPARGSRFVVLLPAATDAPPQVTEGPPPAGQPSSLKILVVDDEPLIRDTFRDLLVEHEVVRAASGREALHLLETQVFDLVFCDLLMPDQTGMDLYEQLGPPAATPRDALVFMTGGAFTSRSRQFLERVANPVLQKPFDPTELERIVEAWPARP